MNFPRATIVRMTPLVLAALALSACAPAPAPTPTAAFASEEEAFAAAEETYRAYLLAAAARAEGDAAADPDRYLSGEALEADLQSQRALQEQGIVIVGASMIEDFTPIQADVSGLVATVTADICIDISESRVMDKDGVDVTLPDRADNGQVTVTFSGNSTSLLISESSPSENLEC